LPLDFFHVTLRTGESNEPVIRVPDVPKSSVLRIIGIDRGQLLRVFAHLIGLVVIAISPESCDFMQKGVVGWVGSTSSPSSVGWNERFFDVPVQFGEVDITQNWTDYRALRRPAEGGRVFPIFEIACLEKFTDEAKKSPVVDLLGQDFQQNLVIQALKTGLYIALKEPGGSKPGAIYLLQGRMTSSSWVTIQDELAAAARLVA
jgi:hypothetical protein